MRKIAAEPTFTTIETIQVSRVSTAVLRHVIQAERDHATCLPRPRTGSLGQEDERRHDHDAGSDAATSGTSTSSARNANVKVSTIAHRYTV
jgi:hypothetical protein